jgi:hypothetical protein
MVSVICGKAKVCSRGKTVFYPAAAEGFAGMKIIACDRKTIRKRFVNSAPLFLQFLSGSAMI